MVIIIIYICAVICVIAMSLVLINTAAFAWNERDIISIILFLCSVVAFLLSIFVALCAFAVGFNVR